MASELPSANANVDTGFIEVLISPGIGCGFASELLTPEEAERLATDKRIIEKVRNHAFAGFTIQQCEDFMRSLGYPRGHGEELKSLTIKKVPIGSLWKIREYAGAETIEVFDAAEWFLAKAQ